MITTPQKTKKTHVVAGNARHSPRLSALHTLVAAPFKTLETGQWMGARALGAEAAGFSPEQKIFGCVVLLAKSPASQSPNFGLTAVCLAYAFCIGCCNISAAHVGSHVCPANTCSQTQFNTDCGSRQYQQRAKFRFNIYRTAYGSKEN